VYKMLKMNITSLTSLSLSLYLQLACFPRHTVPVPSTVVVVVIVVSSNLK
jgi:hypothetical protein